MKNDYSLCEDILQEEFQRQIMRANILFLQQHSLNEGELIGLLEHEGCHVSISRLAAFDDLEDLLLNEKVDLFVIEDSHDSLIAYAQKLLSLPFKIEFPVLYVMPEDNEWTRLELQNLAANHIIFGPQTMHNLASFIDLIILKDRYQKELQTMSGYITEATVVCEKDDEGDFVFKNLNKVFVNLEGVKAETLIGKKVKNSNLVFGLKNILEDMEEVYEKQSAIHMPNYFYIKDEKREWCDVYIYAPNPDQVSVISADLSEIKRAHDKSVQSNRYLQTILNAQHHIIYITDGEKLINTNQAFLDFFECDTMHGFIRSHGSVCNIFEPAKEPFYIDTNEPKWHRKVADNKENRYKIRIQHHQGIKFFFPSVEVINIDDKEQYVVVLTDITELESEKEKLRLLAMTDPMTGIANRLKFNTVVDNLLELALRYETELSIVMFDVDHFKQVNDNHSHQVGDAALKHLTAVVAEHLRKADLFIRWGGEEFLIILSNTDIDNALMVAEKLRKSIEEEEYDEVGKITCSFGVSCLAKEDTLSDFISRVDEALYQAKRTGRNCVKSIVR